MVKNRKKTYLEKLQVHAADTIQYLSNPMKPERERAVCRAFLRSMGLSFSEDEIIAPAEEPADVSFRTARFQVREVMEQGRRRMDEWKGKNLQWGKAQSMENVTEPYGVVIAAQACAPDFLRALVGCIKNEWKNPDGLFNP